MKKRHYLATAAIFATATLMLSACTTGTSSAPKTSKTLTVWMMDGDLSSKTLADVSKRFLAETGVKPTVDIEPWANINTKLTTTLSQDNPPDVVDIGNTDVPLFAANGGLTDLTSHKASLDEGNSWLAGLAGPATIDNKLYAAPLFAGNRVVIYNKKIWAAAGITTVPTSFTELTADLDTIKAANASTKNFSEMYLPGEDWQTNLQFVFDAGGKIATESKGTWASKLSSSASQKGLGQYKAFQNAYSTPSSQSATAYVPDPNQIFGDGLAASMSQVNPIPATLEAKYPALKGEIGTFPWPSENHTGSTMPVFLGGSVVAIPSKSTNQKLALEYVKLIASSAVQKADIVGIDGWTPNSTQLLNETVKSLPPLQQPYFTAAAKSVPTPAAPGWATVESDLDMENLFGAVSTGSKSVAVASSAADALITTALNAK